MNAQFIVIVDGRYLREGDADRLTGYLIGRNWAVWHWFRDVWLLGQVVGYITAADITQDLGYVIRGAPALVIAAQESTVALGNAPLSWLDWFQRYWRAELKASINPSIPNVGRVAGEVHINVGRGEAAERDRGDKGSIEARREGVIEAFAAQMAKLDRELAEQRSRDSTPPGPEMIDTPVRKLPSDWHPPVEDPERRASAKELDDRRG